MYQLFTINRFHHILLFHHNFDIFQLKRYKIVLKYVITYSIISFSDWTFHVEIGGVFQIFQKSSNDKIGMDCFSSLANVDYSVHHDIVKLNLNSTILLSIFQYPQKHQK